MGIGNSIFSVSFCALDSTNLFFFALYDIFRDIKSTFGGIESTFGDIESMKLNEIMKFILMSLLLDVRVLRSCQFFFCVCVLAVMC